MQHQAIPRHVNQDLGAGITDQGNVELDRKAFDDLVSQLRKFGFETAEPTDLQRVARAAKLVTEEAIRRYDAATELERKAKDKLAVADVAEAVGAVIAVQRKRPLFGVFRRG